MNTKNKSAGYFDSIATAIIGDEITQRHTDRVQRIFENSDYLVDFAKRLRKVEKDKAQGHLFELLEVTKFNLDALKKDSSLFASTTESMGEPHNPVDIIISEGKKKLREVQAKSCNSAARSLIALSDKKYEEMARLAPQDQVDKIEELLNRRIEAGTLKAADYEDTRQNLLQSLGHEDVGSSGTTYQEAIDVTDLGVAQDVAANTKINAALTDMHKSGKTAGMVGAGITATVETVKGVIEVKNGEVEVGSVISKVAINSSKAYVTGYATTALSKGITHASHEFLGKAASNAITKSNAPVAISVGIVKSASSMVKYIKGDIGSEQLFDEVNHTAITSATSFYYGALGQVVIPIPVVGALIGSGVGYFIGNVLHQSGLLALGECEVVKAAKERRQAIQKMCLELIPIVRGERLQFEQQVAEHFTNRAAVFTRTFDDLDNAMSNWDSDGFNASLVKLNEQFNQSIKYEKFDDFDAFMKSDEVFSF